MSDISREELLAFTEAHARAAVTMEKITESLIAITQKQDKVIDKTGFIIDAVIRGVNDNYNIIHKETISSLNRIEEGVKHTPADTDKVKELFQEALDNSTIAKDISKTKIFTAIATTVTIVVIIIMRLIGAATEVRISESQVKAIKKEILASVTACTPQTATVLDDATQQRAQ